MLVVFYECETLRESLTVEVFENRLLSGITGKRVGVRREWT